MDPANRRPEQPRPTPSLTPLPELPPDELETMRHPARPPTHGRDFDPYA